MVLSNALTEFHCISRKKEDIRLPTFTCFLRNLYNLTSIILNVEYFLGKHFTN